MNKLPPPPPDLVLALTEPHDYTRRVCWWAGPEFFYPFHFGSLGVNRYLMTTYPEIDHIVSYHSETPTHLGNRRSVVSTVTFKDKTRIDLLTIEKEEQITKKTWLGVNATSQRGDGRIKDNLALRIDKTCQPNTVDQ